MMPATKAAMNGVAPSAMPASVRASGPVRALSTIQKISGQPNRKTATTLKAAAQAAACALAAENPNTSAATAGAMTIGGPISLRLGLRGSATGMTMVSVTEGLDTGPLPFALIVV